jgi:hypothetical protein
VLPILAEESLLETMLGLVWGLAQGVRHALEPDHLAAVSTLVADRKSARQATSYALAWGLGHALVLLAFGGALLVVRAQLPARVAACFELGVAVMLVVLGLRALRRAWVRDARAVLSHQHPAGEHEHSGPADHVHLRGLTLAKQPLVVGCIHGLAGSGALAAVVLAQMASPLAGLAYMAVYGGGAAIGMAGLAGVAGVPLATIVRTRHGMPIVLGTSGGLSLLLGIVWAWTAGTAALHVP